MGFCVLKQHEMLPVFPFLLFRVEFDFLIGCFWKVPLGLGFCMGSFCLINCLSPKQSVRALIYLETARNAARFSFFLFWGFVSH